MNSLKEVYGAIIEMEAAVAQTVEAETAPQGQVNFEQLSEQEKLAYQQALDYEEVGRRMARQVWDEFEKEAAANETGSLQEQILARMAEDPQYTAELLAKYGHLLNQ